ncbi:MAG: putative toxin-antitoxin system toxin component, PIN family [Taibaiella sp.]|nr:putative toxin-antitoxin system toxin component, PIN family [Taibaiella sp.]
MSPVNPLVPVIVPDTNVIVSAGTVSQSPPTQIIQAWRNGDIGIATSESILSEVMEVLSRPYFVGVAGWTQKQVDAYVNELREGAHVVPGTMPVMVSPDPDDNKLFTCALEAQADYIVSGDEKHVLSIGTYEGVQTISPRGFVDAVLEPLQKAA